ncbi:hypothetical protein LIER_22095 [Lithospermum erythrorhizon]|uniref:Uncharacterized protein n=1 Tax=Lithospermum erythrorhizon TaxID=34254 RepID=A0AAV3QY96_LITER
MRLSYGVTDFGYGPTRDTSVASLRVAALAKSSSRVIVNWKNLVASRLSSISSKAFAASLCLILDMRIEASTA